jgi:hypothetical protein
MISRLTAFAAVFSIFAAASLTYAAGVQHAPAAASAKTVRIVQLERVVVVAKRLPQPAI